MKSAKLAASLSDIAAHSPSEKLGGESRYVIVADLRMGDGGKKDELAASKKALFAVLGRWYLPRGYTLVLNGDVEDLRSCWIKDIVSAWPEIYALFDAFAEKGRLRRIVGERDLTLLRLSSYPYELLHGLKLEGEAASILIMHGHQASPPYIGRDYLADYIQHWIGSSKRPPAGKGMDEQARYKVERRLYSVASELGMALIEGHTKRPLFESFANRDFLLAEVERLFREVDSRDGGQAVDEFIRLCRKEAKARGSGSRARRSGPGYDEKREVSPCLFCPGRVASARGLRVLEVEGDALRLVRWMKTNRDMANSSSGEICGKGEVISSGRYESEGKRYMRVEARSTSIHTTLERIAALARKEGGESDRGRSPDAD
jgi:hypothetical protein